MPGQVKAKRHPRTKKKTFNLPLFKVLLHNDEVNESVIVVARICSVIPSMTLKQAIEKVKECHETGVSLLLITHQEKAELLAERFIACIPPLNVSIEPA